MENDFRFLTLNEMKTTIYITLFFLTFAASCKHKQYLTGYFSWEEYQKKAEWDLFVDDKYKPSEEMIDSIAALGITDSLRMDIYLGTYCGDSKKWVPRFFQFRKDLPVNDIQIIVLDTTKIDEKGMAKAAGVEKIPTFIFYDGDRELGRVVEKPKGRLEARMFEILKLGR
jgi:Thioredoxin